MKKLIVLLFSLGFLGQIFDYVVAPLDTVFQSVKSAVESSVELADNLYSNVKGEK